MTDVYMLISNPPHPEADLQQAAPCFETTAAELRMRLNYRSSVIWFAGEELTPLRETATTLQHAGVRVRLIKGRSLAALSQRHELKMFAFGPSGLQLRVENDKTFEVPYDWSVASVMCRPMETEHISRLPAKTATPNKSFRQDATTKIGDIHEPVDQKFVDMYFFKLPSVHRVTIRPGACDFSGLGDAMKPVVNENINTLLQELQTRFASVRDDRRLDNLPVPRPKLINGKTLESQLELADPSLRDIDPYDLLSRLAFLSGA